MHYEDVSKKIMSCKIIADRTKVKNERLDKIGKKRIVLHYSSDYQSPGNMCNKLIETEGKEMNQIKVNSIKEILSKLQK